MDAYSQLINFYICSFIMADFDLWSGLRRRPRVSIEIFLLLAALLVFILIFLTCDRSTLISWREACIGSIPPVDSNSSVVNADIVPVVADTYEEQFVAALECPPKFILICCTLLASGAAISILFLFMVDVWQHRR